MNVASSAQLRPCGDSDAADRGFGAAKLDWVSVGDGFWVRITGITGEEDGFVALDATCERDSCSGDRERLRDFAVESNVIMLAAKLGPLIG